MDLACLSHSWCSQDTNPDGFGSGVAVEDSP